ncbi:MAG TPA: hypothetical protein VJK53_03090 [Candidatus Paceibacterota bacterium]
MKELLGLIAVALAILQSIPYIRDIFRGKTKPHMYTYLIWSIVTAIAFAGQVVAGGGPGAWTTGVMAALTIGILTLCFKYGTGDITKLDVVFLVGALAAIVPWLILEDPMYSVILATIIDVLAFFPTIRKTFNNPTSETLISYISNLIRHPLSILALSTYTVTTVVYPAALFLMNVILVLVIISRRPKNYS